ncbi:MAG: hypothetical protein JKX92_12185 [Porticoccaceae bacterium]|nr:hypothetical protein [Porticoccaceae bacterium]
MNQAVNNSTPKNGFCIAALDEFEWPVDVQVPVNGEMHTHRFTGRFKFMDRDEQAVLFEKLEAEMAELTPSEDSPEDGDPLAATRLANRTVDFEIEMYSHIWVGWSDDLTDMDGNKFVETDAIKTQLLGKNAIREAVKEAYRQAQAGENVRLGNSATSPAGGPAADDQAQA